MGGLSRRKRELRMLNLDVDTCRPTRAKCGHKTTVIHADGKCLQCVLEAKRLKNLRQKKKVRKSNT